MAIDKSILGVAGEFAVAAELCRRNIYAQLTLGHQKRTDLLVFSKTEPMCRIEVKAKQGREWPNCRGISAPDSFLVFVDFAGKQDTERPDFYILTAQEWQAVAVAAKERYMKKYPDRQPPRITNENVIECPHEVNKYGKCYQGCGVRPEQIQEHREAWHKFTRVAGK